MASLSESVRLVTRMVSEGDMTAAQHTKMMADLPKHAKAAATHDDDLRSVLAKRAAAMKAKARKPAESVEEAELMAKVHSSERIGGNGMPHKTGDKLSVITTHDGTKAGAAWAKHYADAHAKEKGFTKAGRSGFSERKTMKGAPAHHTYTQVHTYSLHTSESVNESLTLVSRSVRVHLGESITEAKAVTSAAAHAATVKTGPSNFIHGISSKAVEADKAGDHEAAFKHHRHAMDLHAMEASSETDDKDNPKPKSMKPAAVANRLAHAAASDAHNIAAEAHRPFLKPR